jgi:anti-sigma B factor antagonist
MSIKLAVRQVNDVAVLDASGRITLGPDATTLRETVRDLVAKGQKKLLLNLAEVSYIDSSGIGELVSVFTTVANQGGKVKLLNLTKRVHDLLQITKLYTIFEVFDDEAAALASFSSRAAAAM